MRVYRINKYNPIVYSLFLSILSLAFLSLHAHDVWIFRNCFYLVFKPLYLSPRISQNIPFSLNQPESHLNFGMCDDNGFLQILPVLRESRINRFSWRLLNWLTFFHINLQGYYNPSVTFILIYFFQRIPRGLVSLFRLEVVDMMRWSAIQESTYEGKQTELTVLKMKWCNDRQKLPPGYIVTHQLHKKRLKLDVASRLTGCQHLFHIAKILKKWQKIRYCRRRSLDCDVSVRRKV